MAILKINESEEIIINYHDIDCCGDILYAFQFLFNKKNVINPEILSERYKEGFFIISDCDFEKCSIIDFFEQVLNTKDSIRYENIETPVIHIHCRAWNELKNYKLSLWENAKHSDGKGKYQEGFIESILEFWEKEVELTFSLDSIFTINPDKHSKISLHYETNTDNLQHFVEELRSEFQDFKGNNLEKHIHNSM